MLPSPAPGMERARADRDDAREGDPAIRAEASCRIVRYPGPNPRGGSGRRIDGLRGYRFGASATAMGNAVHPGHGDPRLASAEGRDSEALRAGLGE